MADQKDKGGDTQAAQVSRNPVAPDPRLTRPPNREAGFETTAVCGYDAQGCARTFNLVKGEKLPEGWSDAPPAGTHPNDPGRAAR